jgi:hypothetical protein
VSKKRGVCSILEGDCHLSGEHALSVTTSSPKARSA